LEGGHAVNKVGDVDDWMEEQKKLRGEVMHCHPLSGAGTEEPPGSTNAIRPPFAW
jgi:hypothetical protein